MTQEEALNCYLMDLESKNYSFRATEESYNRLVETCDGNRLFAGRLIRSEISFRKNIHELELKAIDVSQCIVIT